MVKAAWLWRRKSPYWCEFKAELSHGTTGKLSLSTQQLNGYLFPIREGKRQGKERDELCFSSAVPKIQWDSHPHCPYSYEAMGNLYLF